MTTEAQSAAAFDARTTEWPLRVMERLQFFRALYDGCMSMQESYHSGAHTVNDMLHRQMKLYLHLCTQEETNHHPELKLRINELGIEVGYLLCAAYAFNPPSTGVQAERMTSSIEELLLQQETFIPDGLLDTAETRAMRELTNNGKRG